jgi:phage tail-like protein
VRGIERTFEPGPGLADGERAPSEFLEWLSQWVALSLRADVDEEQQRVLIANAVRLYRLRGTKRGLEELVGIYTTLGATIEEAGPRLQIGVHSTVGVDTAVDGGPPHYFRVVIRLSTTRPEEIAARRRVVTSIIDAEKPAHTYYTLDIETPILQVGDTSRVGVDTLLGGEP